jgi:hypothetical protein
VDRSPATLLGGLDHAQVAPPGFLLVEKAATALLGSSELALRLFPLLCGLVALILFSRLAGELLEGWAAPFAVGLFALGTPFVYFSSQVKQYSSDIAATVLVICVAVWFQRESWNTRRALVVAVVGAAMPWFSNPSSLVVAGVAASLTIVYFRQVEKPPLATLLIVLFAWGVSVAAAGIVAIGAVSPIDRAYFDWYWSTGFWPVPPHNIAEALWPWKQLTWVFGTFVSGPQRTNGGLNYPWSFVFVVVMFFGYAALWKQQRAAALFLLLAPALALVASAFRVYPFTGRLIVFLLPGFLLATAAGARHLLASLPHRLQFTTPVILAVLGGSPIYAAATSLPPDRIEHLRPIMTSLAARFEPNDAVYVYYGAAQAFFYYAPRFDMARRDVAIGQCSLSRPRAYLEEIDRFRGRPRVWVLVTRLSPWTNDLEMLTGYLDTIGRRTDSMVVPATRDAPALAAHLFLYDLSQPERLAAASSATFGVAAGVTDNLLAQWGCYGVFAPLRAF